MPQVFRIGSYIIYFWSNESVPIEPIHVHIGKGDPSQNDTKVWITKAGKPLLCHNKSRIPDSKLRNVMDMLEARSFEIMQKWQEQFGEIKFYC